MSDDRRILQAFVALESDRDFQVIKAWLVERREKARSNEGIKDDVLMRWQQGRAQELNDIIEAMSTAREVLTKFKK